MSKLGQLVMCGVSGTALTNEERSFLTDRNIGGVIIFAHNFESPAQLAELINEIQTCRDEYPLFIGIDQEGGRVRRLKTHFAQFPSMYEIGCLDSPKMTYEVHRIMGKELAACGININFSPCSDVWTREENKVIGDRAFAKNTEDVEKHVSAAIRGLQTSGVIACSKHFPGHGETLKDSHYDLPYVKTTLEQLETRELKPFIKASRSRVGFMMMAHLVVDAIDEELPTSLSKKAYAFLREKTKFKNVVCTDDMEMKAISDNFGYGEAAVLAINAGADLIMYRSMDTASQALIGLEKAFQDGKLKSSTVEDRHSRLIKMKKSSFAEYSPIYIPKMAKVLGSDETEKFLEELREKLDQNTSK